MSQPSFSPTPVRHRADGWTPAKQIAFIEALGASSCVSGAARSVGMSEQSAYRLRNRADSGEFARAWDAAVQVGVKRLTDVAFERVVEGVEEPIYWRGELVGMRRRYDNRLLMFLMRHHQPQLYSPEAQRPGWTQSPYLSALLDETQARLKAAEARAEAAERAVREGLGREGLGREEVAPEARDDVPPDDGGGGNGGGSGGSGPGGDGDGAQAFSRHAGLGSASTVQQAPSAQAEERMPGQVRHDGDGRHDDDGERGDAAPQPQQPQPPQDTPIDPSSPGEAEHAPPLGSMFDAALMRSIASFGSRYAQPDQPNAAIDVEAAKARILALIEEMNEREREEAAAMDAAGELGSSPERSDRGLANEGAYTPSEPYFPHLSPEMAGEMAGTSCPSPRLMRL